MSTSWYSGVEWVWASGYRGGLRVKGYGVGVKAGSAGSAGSAGKGGGGVT